MVNFKKLKENQILCSTKLTFLLMFLILAVIPLFFSNYTVHILILALLFAVLAISWNLLVGYAGIFSMGQHAFFGLGAYVSALLAMKLGISPWLGLLIAGLVAAVSGALIGLPVLRLRAAPYVAILTLAFAEIIKMIASNLTDLTRGEQGLSGIPPFDPIGPISFTLANRLNSYYLILGLFCIIFFLVYKTINGPVGLALKAIRESQDAAESLGVNLTKYKMYAFLLSSFIAGMAGSFYAHYVQVLTPSSVLGINVMMQILIITLLGGMGTMLGPIVGSFIIIIGLESLRFLGDYRMIIYGIALVLIIMFMSEGVTKKLFPKSKEI